MTTNKQPKIQLSYLDLNKLSGYEKPYRKCWHIHNKRTNEVARVVSTCTHTAVRWLGWDIEECDISCVGKVRQSPGVKSIIQLHFANETKDTRK